MALTKAQVKANLSKEKAKNDFRRKYGATQKNIEQMQNRINTMVKSGGGPILETEENKKVLADMLTKMATDACSKNYDGNLEAQKKYLQKQLEMLTAKDVVAEVEKNADITTKLQVTIYDYLVKQLTPGGDSSNITLEELQKKFGDTKKQINQDISKFIERVNEYADKKYPYYNYQLEGSNDGGVLIKWSSVHITEYGKATSDTSTPPIVYSTGAVTESLFATIESSDEFKDVDTEACEIAAKINNLNKSGGTLDEVAKNQAQMKSMQKQIQGIQKQFLQNVQAAFRQICSSYEKSLNKAASMAEKMNEKVLKACKKQIEVQEMDVSSLDKLKNFQMLEDAAKKFAKLPQDLMKDFDKLESILFLVVTGFLRNIPSLDIKGDVDSVLQKLQSMMDPVFDGVTKLKLPLPPVASPISDILKMMSSKSSDTSTLTDDQKKLIEKWKDKAQIPDTWKQSLSSMMQTINLLMMMLPTLLVQLIFNMINALISIVKNLWSAVTGGELPLPYPLNLLDTAIELMPKIFSLMKTMPQVMYEAGKKKLKEMAAQMQVASMGYGGQISQLFTSFPTVQCPEQIKKAMTEKIEAEKEKKDLETAKNNEKILAEREKSSQEIEKAKDDMYSSFGNGFVSSLKDLGGSFSEDAAAKSMLLELENKNNIALILKFQNDAMSNKATIENQATNKVSKVND